MVSQKAAAAILVLLAGLAQAAHSASPRCPAERHTQMDECASRMGFLGDHSFRVPKNQTAMGKFCTQLKDSISCIQAYTRDCLQGFTRQLLTSLLRRGKQQYSLICKDDSSRKNFMATMSCLTDDKIDNFHLCMDASIARFELIASARVRSDHKLPALCCSYQIFNRDVDATLGAICGANSTQGGGGGGRASGGRAGDTSGTREFVRKIVGGTAGEFFGLICEQHRSLDDCRASSKTSKTLPMLEEASRQVAARKLKPVNRSLVPVLLEVLDGSASQ